MTEPITYRRAQPEDILSLCKLGQILNAVHHAARPDVYVNATDDVARDKAHWLPSLQEPNRVAFLAEHGDDAVGFITVQLTQPTSPLLQAKNVGRIGSIGVVPGQQGRGIGRVLMRLAEDWARERGADDLRLMVWGFNEQAIHLYRELGYEVSAFEMEKPLGAVCDSAAM
jgi:ribosomal protein S18 acetylase RimI-like enzyme